MAVTVNPSTPTGATTPGWTESRIFVVAMFPDNAVSVSGRLVRYDEDGNEIG